MKKFLLSIAALAALVIPAGAYAPKNNLFIELRNCQILYKGGPMMLEDVQELITSSAEPTDNVIVTVDDITSVVMLLGIRDYVAEVSPAQVIFVLPYRPGYHGSMMLFSPIAFTLDPSPFFEPFTPQEFYAETLLWENKVPLPEEPRGITVLMDNLDTFYMNGEKVHYSSPFPILKDFVLPNEPADKENAEEPQPASGSEVDEDSSELPDINDVEVPYFRVKLTEDATVEDLLTYNYVIDWYAVEDMIEMNTAFFTPNSRVAVAAAFNVNPTTLDDLDIDTVNFTDKDKYSVQASYLGSTTIEDITSELSRYLPADPGHARGRCVVRFTVGIDGKIKDVEYESGMKAVYELVQEGLLERSAPYWTPAKDLDGNPVNMRFRMMFKYQR